MMNWQTLFNPFSKISEKRLLAIGILSFAVNSVVCFYTSTKMDSIFHFSPQKNLSLSSAFSFTAVSNASAMFFLFLLSRVINKRTRFIDIANTVFISQVPNFLILLCIKFSGLETLASKINTTNGTPPSLNLDSIAIIPFTIGIILMLAFIIYGFVLMYNGFKTATNLKKGYHIALFIISLFLFITFHQVYIQYLHL